MNERSLRIAGAVLVAVVAVWAGVRIHAALEDRPYPGIRTTAGVASPPTASDLIGESVPQPTHIPDRLPDFSLASIEGRPTSIRSFGDKSLVINFWATWCAPCRREIPLLKGLSAEWAARDIQIVGIAVDHRAQVAEFARELRIPYPILVGEQDALDAAAALGFGSPVFPFTVFTDRRGEVVALFVGELHPDQAALILSVVENLNQGQTQLKAARQSITEGLRHLQEARPG